MANDKKVLFLNNGQIIAIKLDHDSGLCTIGGHKSTFETLMILLTDYFQIPKADLPELRMTTRNKGRFTFECKLDKYTEVCQTLREEEFTLEDVLNHGSIMR